jgi:hypothetical protein
MVVGHKKLHDVSASLACAWWATAAGFLALKLETLQRVVLFAVLLLFPIRIMAGYPAFHRPIDGTARLPVCRLFNRYFVLSPAGPGAPALRIRQVSRA